MNTRRLRIKTTVLMSACLGLSLTACSPQPAAKLPPPSVIVQTVAQQDVQVPFEFTGQTQGSREVEIRPRVNGILLKRHFKEGSKVNAGDLLYQIDPAEYQTALAQSQAQLSQQQALLAQYKRNLARQKPLLADNAVSRKDVDDSQSDVERGEALVKAAQAQVEQAKLNLSYTRIVAPISGIVGISQRAEGALVNGQNTLLTNISQTDPIYVLFSLSENEKLNFDRTRQSGRIVLEKRRTAPDVRLKLADGSIYPLSGKMNFADSLFSSNTGTLQLRAEFPNPKQALMTGQFAKATITGYMAPGAMLIPQRAVATTAAGAVAYVVNASGNAEARPLELGAARGTDVFVFKGLKAGEQLIVDGIMKVQAGKPVKIVPAADASAAAPAPATK